MVCNFSLEATVENLVHDRYFSSRTLTFHCIPSHHAFSASCLMPGAHYNISFVIRSGIPKGLPEA